MQRAATICTALAVVLGAASGCGGDDGTTASPSSSAPSTSAAATSDPSAALDESNCQDPDFYDANVEFCAGGGLGPGGSETEGSVADPATAFVLEPDGLRAEIAGVTAGPNAISNADPTHDAEVIVTVLLTNTGQQTIPLPDAGGYVVDQLYYGENLYEAQQWTNPDDSPGSSDLPKQLVPGTGTTFTATFTLPSAGLTALAFAVNPNNEVYLDFTFLDVETLIGS